MQYVTVRSTHRSPIIQLCSDIRKKQVLLAILMSVTTLFPINIVTTKQVELLNHSEIARFNRRFIQINDYLFNGVEAATAVASHQFHQNHLKA